MTSPEAHAPEPDPLSRSHRHELEVDSGIPPEVIAERGYRTVRRKVDLKNCGFGERQARVPALLIPVWGVCGNVVGYQCKPDLPRVNNGKVLKYETPAGMKMVIDVAPRVRSLLGDPRVPLWVSEGVKKVDRAAAAGLCCIGLLGVWNWRGKNDDGGMTALADWESIALKGREVVIAFDSDVLTKKPVLGAMRRLREFLKSRGATVRICVLKPGPHGEKTGLDDFFVRGGTVEDLVLCVQDDLPKTDEDELECEYEGKTDGIWWNKPTSDGPQPVPLCNFSARVVREVVRDDGAEQTRVLQVEVSIGGDVRIVDVPIERLGAANWHLTYFGFRAQVQPGIPPQRLVHAIQSLSDPTTATVYTHTGWRKVDETYLFLTSGAPIGPIGPLGPLPEIEIELRGGVGVCALPKPPAGDALARAAKAMLNLLDIAPAEVMYPLVLSAVRAPLGDVDFGVFLEGDTGVRKTAVAAVVQSFFGKGFDANNLPGSWSSTANANEEMMFTAKDIVVVVDDFVPVPGTDRGALDAAADRTFRGLANRAGRQRLRADGSPRPERPPRCLAIGTGEVLPRGRSLLARVVIVELRRDAVDLDLLTKGQRDGADGVLAEAMAGYVQWLAPQLERRQRAMAKRTQELRRDLLPRGWHGRTATTIANLIAVSEVFVDFLLHAEAIEGRDAASLREEAKAALTNVGDSQAPAQQGSDPVDQFISLLVAALASGRAHLCGSTLGEGPPPGKEQLAGWTDRDGNRSAERWSSRGERIGWLSESDDVYLIPDAAEAVVQRLARERADGAVVVGASLRKRLRDRGLLMSTETRGKARLVVRKTIGGVRRDVVHMHATALWPDVPLPPEEVAQVAQSDASTASEGSCGGPLPGSEWPNGDPAATESGPIPVSPPGDEWCTPVRFVGAARSVLGAIDLDPATNQFAQARIQATEYFTIDDDGLSRPWRGRVWLNPPYSHPLVEQFVNKLIDDYKGGEVHAAVLLTNCSSSATWYQLATKVADAFCLPGRRIAFERPDGSGPQKGNRFSQTFFYFGPDAERFRQVFEPLGQVLTKGADPEKPGAGAA